MTKKERINRKRLARYYGSYSQRARGYFELMYYKHFSQEQMIETCRHYYFYNIEYDVEKDKCVKRYHKQWAIIARRLAKKVHRIKKGGLHKSKS